MAVPTSPRYAVVRYLLAEKEHVALLNQLLKDSASEIQAQILANAGRTGASATLTNIQLRAQLASILSYQSNMWRGIENIVRNGRQDAAAAASRVVSRYEQDLLQLSMSKSTFQALADSEAERAASGVENTVTRILSSEKPLSERVYNAEALSTRQVSNLVNRGLIQGWTARQLADQVKKYIDPSVPGGVSYSALRLARTEINNAFHATSIDRYKQDGIVDDVDWVLSTSHPEGDICDDLAANGPYPVDEVPEKPHPQCFCNIQPHLPTPDEFLAKLFAGDYGDAPWTDSVSDIGLPTKSGSGSKTLAATSIPEEAVIKSGMSVAERQRVYLERAMFNSRGNYNAANGWSSETQHAWMSYIEGGGKYMNQMLRDPAGFMASPVADMAESVAIQTQHVIDLISKNALTEDVFVARGVMVAPTFNPALLDVGDSFGDAAFLSTTTNMKEAINFASGRGAGGEGWTFISKAPKGTNALAGADYQNEIIFGPGQIQTITGVDAERRIIYTEMIS